MTQCLNSSESSLSLPLRRFPFSSAPPLGLAPLRSPASGPFLARFSLCIVFKVRLRPFLRLPFGPPRERACIEYQKSAPVSTPFLKFFLKKLRKIKASGRFCGSVLECSCFLSIYCTFRKSKTTIWFSFQFDRVSFLYIYLRNQNKGPSPIVPAA